MLNNLRIFSLTVILFVVVTSVLSVAKADTIILANGDTLTGTVISQGDKTITVKSPILGKLVIAKKEVKSIQIEQKSEKKEKTPPPVSESKKENKSKTNKPEAKTKAPEIKKDEGFFDSPFFKNWKTEISLGFAGSSGNTKSQSVNAEFKTRKKTDDIRWIFDSKYFYGSDDGKTSENEFSAKLTHDWLFSGTNWLLFANGQYEYNQFKEWESRVSGYLGVGYTFVDKKELSVTGRLGFGGTQHLGGDEKFTPEAMLGATAAHWKITKNQTINLSNTIYPALNGSGQFRNILEANWKIKIDQDDGLSLKLGIQDEYDSQPAKGDKSNDFKYYGSLVYDF